MKEIKFFGAAGEVTGSAFEIKSNAGTKCLIDCGMFQGQENDKRNKGIDTEAGFAVLTHAHLDHIGKIPHFNGKVIMTHATQSLSRISLRNANALSQDLYHPGSIGNTFMNTAGVHYNSPVNIDGLSLTFRNAGHILGASSIEIQEKGGDIIVFSGDLGNANSRTVHKPTPIKGADIVVMETTYGDRNHPEENPVEMIEDAIKRIRKSKGTLLIPAFAIDRTQTILNILKELSEQKKLKGISVFLDAPMAIEITSVYRNYPQMLNDELEAEKRDPFNFSELIKTHDKKDSDKIYRHHGPRIIISGSGMMSGGRIMKHAAYCLSDRKSAVLLVGYCAEGTPGREVMDGEKNVWLDSEYKFVHVNAGVLQTSSLSSHADQKQLLSWLRKINDEQNRLKQRNIRQVILVHGEDHAREQFALLIKEQLGIQNVSLPKENETINLQQKSTSGV
jgi:metallo-beta-lactamase family protein